MVLDAKQIPDHLKVIIVYSFLFHVCRAQKSATDSLRVELKPEQSQKSATDSLRVELKPEQPQN